MRIFHSSSKKLNPLTLSKVYPDAMRILDKYKVIDKDVPDILENKVFPIDVISKSDFMF